MVEQGVPDEPPACFIGCADEAAGEMGRVVGRAVEVGAVASGLAVEQPHADQ